MEDFFVKFFPLLILSNYFLQQACLTCAITKNSNNHFKLYKEYIGIYIHPVLSQEHCFIIYMFLTEHRLIE